MIVTCPACGRTAAVADATREVVCACRHRYDPSARPTVADPFLGREIEGYRIEELLGSGGMGTVYRATQLSLARAVAFKVLPAHVAEDPHFVRRFHREAEVLASLSHQNVVQIIDRGEQGGRFFIVMEYIDGENLRDLMKRGPVEGRQACRIVAGLCAALDYAHSEGVVHRDIKPENVLVGRDGVVKVADFGLSRVVGGDEAHSRLTHTHLVMGTYEYMAPEQRESSREADARSDIYATAVVFYEMLTGELPIGRFEPPSRRVPGLDRRLDAVVERGLAKDPDARYARASAMGGEITSLLKSPEVPADLEAPVTRKGVEVAEQVRRRVRNMRSIFRRSPEDPQPPTRFEMRLDLLLTLLSVVGLLTTLTGVGFLIADETFRFAFVVLDNDFAGLAILTYGALLWNAAERARKYWPGARVMLLALTAMAAPTLIAVPFIVWTWGLLLDQRMRVYMDARFRGLGAADAAAFAQGLQPQEADREPARDRRRAAVAANRRAMLLAGALAMTAWIAWFIVYRESAYKAFEGEGMALFAIAWAATGVSLFFLKLERRLQRGRSVRLNALVWSLIAFVAPSAARRARMLARDARDGLI